MILNDQELKLFESLNQSEVGKILCEYLERLKKEIGYLPEDTEVAKKTIEAIDTFLIQKIKSQTERKEPNINQYVE